MFNESYLNKIAYETGFCQRKRKLSPKVFLESLMYKTFEGNNQSLSNHTMEILLHNGVQLKKQSLDERFNASSVKFIKEILTDCLAKRSAGISSGLSDNFSYIYVQDSTRFGLPTGLKNSFPGFGGRAKMDAGGQIQFAYELKSNSIQHIEFLAATVNDSKVCGTSDWLQKNSLLLRDLGYFSMNLLKEIIEKEAYFVSRVKSKTVFYHLINNKYEKLDVVKLIAYMKRHRIKTMEKNVLVGAEDKLPVRACFCLMPEEIKEQRISKARTTARQRGWEFSKEYQTWAGINVFITNAKEDKLPISQLSTVYKLRWQIELVFKSWKSYYKIHLYKSIKQERLECYLYASLLYMAMHWKIFSLMQAIVFKEQNIILSILKFTKVIIQLKNIVRNTLENIDQRLDKLLTFLWQASPQYIIKENKKGKITYVEMIKLC